jgi:hypothetical protein
MGLDLTAHLEIFAAAGLEMEMRLVALVAHFY